MSKIPRDARAFAQRVKMGATRLWLLAEGRGHDRTFYDRILDSVPGLSASDYDVRLVEQLQLDGVSSGGKKFVRKVFEVFEDEGLLVQHPADGARIIAFAIDRDVDDIAGERINHDHVMYTRSMDVESEIIRHSNLPAGISSAYSLTAAQANQIAASGLQLLTELATLWQPWIELGVTSHCCGVGTPIQHSRRSQVNQGGYGPVDVSAVSAEWQKLSGAVASAGPTAISAYRSTVQAVFASGNGWMLIKGKWAAGYVHHLMKVRLSSVPVDANIPADTVVRTCLETINFDAPWAEPYRASVARMLAAA